MISWNLRLPLSTPSKTHVIKHLGFRDIQDCPENGINGIRGVGSNDGSPWGWLVLTAKGQSPVTDSRIPRQGPTLNHFYLYEIKQTSLQRNSTYVKMYKSCFSLPNVTYIMSRICDVCGACTQNCLEFRGGLSLNSQVARKWFTKDRNKDLMSIYCAPSPLDKLSFWMVNWGPKSFPHMLKALKSERDRARRKSAVCVGGLAGDNHRAKAQRQKIQFCSWAPPLSHALAQTPEETRMQKTWDSPLRRLRPRAIRGTAIIKLQDEE